MKQATPWPPCSEFRFDTQLTGDIIPPNAAAQLTTTVGGDANLAEATTNILVTFSEVVTLAPNWYSLNCDGTSVDSSVMISASPNTIAEVNPQNPLPNDASCTLSITASAVEDTSGNLLLSDFNFDFNVQQITPLRVQFELSSTFGLDANVAEVDSNIIVTFSKPVTINGPWYSLSCPAEFATTVTSIDAIYTIDPTDNSGNLRYDANCTFTINNAANITDTDGNNPTGNLEFSFSVRPNPDSTPPTVTNINLTSTTDIGGSNLATNDSAIEVRFSERIMARDGWFTLNCSLVTVDSTTFTVSTTEQSGNTVLVITRHSSDPLWVYGDTCTLMINDTFITDLASTPNQLTPYSTPFRFTVEPNPILPPPLPPAPSSTTCSGVNDYPACVLQLVNDARQTANTMRENNIDNRQLLALCLFLNSASIDHANYLDQTGAFSHTGEGGTSSYDRIIAVGYAGNTTGENIARGQTTPEQVVTDWLDSPGHRSNILSPNFQHMGLAYLSSSHTWVQTFGGGATNCVDANPPTPTPDTPIPLPMFVSSSPQANAMTVAVDTNLALTFDTDVTAPDIAFTLTCGSSTVPFTSSLAAGTAHTTHTLNPNNDLPASAHLYLKHHRRRSDECRRRTPRDITITFTTAQPSHHLCSSALILPMVPLMSPSMPTSSSPLTHSSAHPTPPLP